MGTPMGASADDLSDLTVISGVVTAARRLSLWVACQRTLALSKDATASQFPTYEYVIVT